MEPVDDATEYKDGRKGGFDPHARIPDMDLDGIDAAYLYSSIGLFAGAVEDSDISAAICRAYNRWLTDYCKPYPDRLFGIAMIPLQSVPHAIAEMKFAREELGMTGIFVRNRGKTPGSQAFFACSGSTRCDSLRMCRNPPRFPS